MKNRWIYGTGITAAFVLLASVVFILFAVKTESPTLTRSLVRENSEYVTEFHPAYFLRHAILSPVLDTTLTEEERLIFKMDEEMLQETSSGINLLSPFYFSYRKEKNEPLYLLYFSLSSVTDFVAFSKRQENVLSGFVFHNNAYSGVVAYSPTLPEQEITALLEKEFSPSGSGEESFFNREEKQQENPSPFLLYSKEKKATQLDYHVAENKITFSGSLSSPYDFTPISTVLKKDPRAFYLATVTNQASKDLLTPYIRDYVSVDFWESVRGVEMNYYGVLINPKTKKPEPVFSLHLHYLGYTGEKLLPENIQYSSDSSSIDLAGKIQLSVQDSGSVFSLYNAPFTHISSGKPVIFAVSGIPQTVLRIDEPFKSVALGLYPELRALDRFTAAFEQLDCQLTLQNGILSIHQEATFKPGINPFFELFYLARKTIR